MLHLIFARAGFGKTCYLHRVIRNMQKNGETDMLLLVPEQISFESEKEILEILGPQNMQSISVFSFTRLADAFFDRFGGRKKRSIDFTGRSVVMDIALQNVAGELTLFQKQIASPAFAKSLLNIFEYMKRANVTPAQLMQQAEKQTGIFSSKLRETALILSEYAQLLNNEFYDPLDDLTLMANMLPSHDFFGGKTVLIDSFSGFTAQQFALLEKMIFAAKDVYITLGFDGMVHGEDLSLFSNMSKTAEQLKALAKKNNVKIATPVILTEHNRFQTEDLRHLEQNLFMPDFEIMEEPAPNITVCRARTVHDEADFAARTIRRLVRERQMRYRDFAVIARTAQRYDGIIDKAFARYNIPCYVDSRKGVEHLCVFRFVFYAMSAVLGTLDTGNILSLLKTGLTGQDMDTVCAVDNYTSIWRLSGEDWNTKWEGHPKGSDASFDEEDKAQLSRINACRAQTVELLTNFQKEFCTQHPVRMAKAIYRLLTESKVSAHLLQYCEKLEQNGQNEQADLERRSYDLLIHQLDQMVMALGDREITPRRFLDLFELSLSFCDIGSLPQGLDEVEIGCADRMRPKSPKITFILGANESVFPAVLQSEGLFTDAEYAALYKAGIPLPFYNEEAAVDENYLVYSAVCSASQAVFITYAAADPAGAPLSPALFVETICEMFPNCNSIDANDGEIENETGALDVLAKDMRLSTPLAASVDAYFKAHPTPRFQALQNACQIPAFSLSPETATALFGKNIHTSASKIDVFHKCKFSFFCQYGLKVDPQREVRLDVLQRGSLVHFVLEKTIADYTPDAILQMDDEALYAVVSALTDTFLKPMKVNKKSDAAESYFETQLKQMLTQLVRRVFADLKQTDFEVLGTEIEIGGDTPDVEAYELPLPDGGKVTLTGKIDRADIYRKDGQNYVRILDYKTGEKEMRLSDMLYGQNLQMAVYMMALQKHGYKGIAPILPAGMFYWQAKEKTASLPPDSSDQEIGDALLKEQRMNGLFIDDIDCVHAMEPDGKGLFIPASFTQSGALNKRSVNYYSLEQYGILTRHIEKLLVQMGLALHSGDVSVHPLDGSRGACDYCAFGGICRHNTQENDQIKPMKNADILKGDTLRRLTQEEPETPEQEK